MIKNIAFDLLKFLIEFIKLFPVMYIIMGFDLQSKKKIILYSIGALLLCIIASASDISGIMPITAYICFIYTTLILKGKRKTIYGLAVYTGISIMDLLPTTVYSIFDENNDFEQIMSNKVINIVSNSVSILIIGIIITLLLIFKRHSNNNYRINIFYLFLIIAGEVSIGCFITAFQFVKGYSKAFAVMLCIGGIVFLILSVVMMINYISKNHYKEIAEINEKLSESKENYYTMLLQKDKDTIKFRHDINKHLNCMYILFDKGKYDELRKYFDKIGAELNELRPQIQTGNDLVSAILNDIADKYSSVKYEIEGKLLNEISMCSMDLCTIFYNLFENAFAAADESDKKSVKVSFKYIGCNLFCRIENSTSHNVTVSNNRLVTEKEDKENHGIGTRNVADCIEKNGGTIEFSCDNNLFLAEVVFPIM